MENIAACFRAARSFLELEQETVAEETKMTRNMLGRLEDGSYVTVPAEITALQKYYELRGIVFLPGTREVGPGIRWNSTGNYDPFSRLECRVARALLGLSQRQLATAAKLGQGVVARFEKDLERSVRKAVVETIWATLDQAGALIEKSPNADYVVVRLKQ